MLLSTPLLGDGVQDWGRRWSPHRKPPYPTWAMCLAHLLLTNTLKKNSEAKMLCGMVSWHGEFSRQSHLGAQVQVLVVQIMRSTCQSLTFPSTPQTLGEH